MNLNYNENMILQMLNQHPNLGKTAVMKAVFMLQQVKNIDLGYAYSIYTYGPYSADVMEDIETLIGDGMVESKVYPYQNYIGYELSVSKKGLQHMKTLSASENEALGDIVHFVDGKSAKELELYSTIIFINDLYSKNLWEHNPENIVKKVREIKPHFDEDVILGAYNLLSNMQYLVA